MAPHDQESTAILDTLRHQGHRLTPQRMEVVQVISAHTQHLTAEEIHAAIVVRQPSLDIATVYRILQWLQGIAVVAPIDIGDNKLRYEYHPHGNHHHHLVCQCCGTTIQIADDRVDALQAELLAQFGFTLAEHLTLPGRCRGCAGHGS